MLDDYKSHINKLYEAEEAEEVEDNNPIIDIISSIGGKIKNKYETLKKKTSKIGGNKSKDGVELFDGENLKQDKFYIIGKWTDSDTNKEHEKSDLQPFGIKLTSYEDGLFSFSFANENNNSQLEVFEPFREEGDKTPKDKTKGKYILADSNNMNMIISNKEEKDSKCIKLNNREYCVGKEYFTFTKHENNYIVVVIGITNIDEKNNLLYFEPQQVYSIDNSKLVKSNIDNKTIKYLGQVDGNKSNTKAEYVTNDKDEIIDMINHYDKNVNDVQDNDSDYSQVEQMTTKDINEFTSELHSKISDDKNLTYEQLVSDMKVILNYIIKSKIEKSDKYNLLKHVKDTINTADKKFDKSKIVKLINDTNKVKKLIDKND